MVEILDRRALRFGVSQSSRLGSPLLGKAGVSDPGTRSPDPNGLSGKSQHKAWPLNPHIIAGVCGPRFCITVGHCTV